MPPFTWFLTIALPQKSLARTRKVLSRASNGNGVSSTTITDDDQEEYLTSNSLEYNEGSDSGSEYEQGSEEDSAARSDVGSDGDESPSPFRSALKKSKSRPSMASSTAIDQGELEQVMFEAALKESRRTAVQERKVGQSSRGAGSSSAVLLPDFDGDTLSDLTDDHIPLKMKGKGKGKGGATVDWDDSDAEGESWEVAGEFDAPELTAKEKKELAQITDPVKIHQRAMARKLGRKLTHASPFRSPTRIYLTVFSGREDFSRAASPSP